jgi:hypothetical protein
MTQGKITYDKGTWQVETKNGPLPVHRSCLPDLTEDLDGKTVDYATLKDFTSNKQGVDYALPILQDPDSIFLPTDNNRDKKPD